jgi:hypothetical protein
MRPLEPLPSHLPAPPRPAPPSSPAADRRNSPPAASGRRPAGAPREPLQACFRFEELARQVVITLVRAETQEVVRQIPPEEIVNLIVYLREAVARALDKRA